MKAPKSELAKKMIEAGLGRDIEKYLQDKYELDLDPKPIEFEGKLYYPEYVPIEP